MQANGQSIQVNDANVWKTLWGIVPTVNMQEIVLQTITVTRGTSFDLKVLLNDNVGLKTVELSQPDWLYSKYINFENADGEIPQNPLSYEFTAQVIVPNAAISDVLIETFYFNDGSTIKYLQPYRKLNLNVVDVNMNARVIPVFVKVE